ncbi:hypothetical protein [Nocardiopsis chromatogenes]|uniref:hypothetical protein n=1 Tax=Nocardiopsis chromatogenes TaxID=280239 RepID=UPI0012688AFF|nr:hypothetical protein [Nocardiopsis chromatogenes]
MTTTQNPNTRAYGTLLQTLRDHQVVCRIKTLIFNDNGPLTALVARFNGSADEVIVSLIAGKWYFVHPDDEGREGFDHRFAPSGLPDGREDEVAKRVVNLLRLAGKTTRDSAA